MQKNRSLTYAVLSNAPRYVTDLFGGVDVSATLDEHLSATLALTDPRRDVQRSLLVRPALDLNL